MPCCGLLCDGRSGCCGDATGPGPHLLDNPSPGEGHEAAEAKDHHAAVTDVDVFHERTDVVDDHGQTQAQADGEEDDRPAAAQDYRTPDDCADDDASARACDNHAGLHTDDPRVSEHESERFQHRKAVHSQELVRQRR